MMRLSTKGRYGARLMLELALSYGKERGTVLLKDIAERQEISQGYLEHLLPPLRAAGLVRSTRGAHGGYTLAKAPQDITLGEVVQVLEGSMAVVECVTAPEVCPRVNLCITRGIWEEITGKITGVLESVTLQDMINRQKKKEAGQPLMYSI